MTHSDRILINEHVQKLFHYVNRMTGSTPIEFPGDDQSIKYNAERAAIHLKVILDTLKDLK